MENCEENVCNICYCNEYEDCKEIELVRPGCKCLNLYVHIPCVRKNNIINKKNKYESIICFCCNDVYSAHSQVLLVNENLGNDTEQIRKNAQDNGSDFHISNNPDENFQIEFTRRQMYFNNSIFGKNETKLIGFFLISALCASYGLTVYQFNPMFMYKSTIPRICSINEISYQNNEFAYTNIDTKKISSGNGNEYSTIAQEYVSIEMYGTVDNENYNFTGIFPEITCINDTCPQTLQKICYVYYEDNKISKIFPTRTIGPLYRTLSMIMIFISTTVLLFSMCMIGLMIVVIKICISL